MKCLFHKNLCTTFNIHFHIYTWLLFHIVCRCRIFSLLRRLHPILSPAISLLTGRLDTHIIKYISRIFCNRYLGLILYLTWMLVCVSGTSVIMWWRHFVWSSEYPHFKSNFQSTQTVSSRSRFSTAFRL